MSHVSRQVRGRPVAALFVDFQSIKNEGLDHIAHKECQKASQFYFQFETTERQHKDKRVSNSK